MVWNDQQVKLNALDVSVRKVENEKMKKKELHEQKYNERYDAYYDEVKNIWLEKRCKDSTCEFCKDRPDRPMWNHNHGDRSPVIFGFSGKEF